MKTTILCFLFSFCALGLAQANSPLLAVQNLIQQAKEGKADLEGVETRGLAKDKVIELLKKMDPDKDKFMVDYIIEKDPNLHHLRTVNNPGCIGFTVRRIPGKENDGKGRYVVTGVLP